MELFQMPFIVGLNYSWSQFKQIQICQRNQFLIYFSHLMKNQISLSFSDSHSIDTLLSLSFAKKHKRIAPHFDKHKEILVDPAFYFGNSNVSSTKFFEVLLDPKRKLDSDSTLEVSRIVCWSLKKDSQGFLSWKNIYHRHLPQSLSILNCISENWFERSFDSSLSTKYFQEFLEDVSKIHEKVSVGNYNDPVTNMRAKKVDIENGDQILSKLHQLRSQKNPTAKQKVSPNSTGSGTSTVILSIGLIFGTLSLGIVVAGAYIANNCCENEWCKTNKFVQEHLNQYLNC